MEAESRLDQDMLVSGELLYLARSCACMRLHLSYTIAIACTAGASCLLARKAKPMALLLLQ